MENGEFWEGFPLRAPLNPGGSECSVSGSVGKGQGSAKCSVIGLNSDVCPRHELCKLASVGVSDQAS